MNIDLTVVIIDPPFTPNEVECPYCEAQPGESCRRDPSYRDRRPHQRRQDRWEGMLTMYHAIVQDIERLRKPVTT